MTTLKNCDVYLIVCQGQGNIDVGLVNKETWDWINSDYVSDESAYEETIAPSIMKAYPDCQYVEETIFITSGSYDNDRALSSPKERFDSITDAMKFIKKNKCNLVDEFHGCIYQPKP